MEQSGHMTLLLILHDCYSNGYSKTRFGRLMMFTQQKSYFKLNFKRSCNQNYARLEPGELASHLLSMSTRLTSDNWLEWEF